MTDALTGGCLVRHPHTFRMLRPNGTDHFVVLLIRTSGEFQINEHLYKAYPNYALILAPHTDYSYGNPNGEYIDDYMHFQTNDETYFEEMLRISNTPFPVDDLEFCSFCIQHILLENQSNSSAHAQDNIDALFTVLFNHLIDSHASRNTKKAANTLQNRLYMLRLRIAGSVDDEHNIRKYANQMHISESYFQYLYKGLFGISFGRDLIQMRIEQAKSMIRSTNLPLCEIASMCGYASEVHFYRQFRKMVGTTPARFRKDNL